VKEPLAMTDKQVEQLENRINDLECQLAFQEQTIDSLNDALSQQQLLITKMQDQMKYVVGKVKNIDNSNLADPSEEAPPPHY
jgi:SlyX protein